MGIRAYELEVPERSSVLPGAGADCSYTDSRTAHLSAPHCLAALQVWGLGQQLVQVTHGGVVEAPGWCFFWETSLCWSLDTTEAQNGPGSEWLCHGEASSSAKWVTREAHRVAPRSQ